MGREPCSRCMRFEAIIFDVDHTLCTDGHCEHRVLVRLLEELQFRQRALARGARSTHIDTVEAQAEDILKRVRAGPLRILPALHQQFESIARVHPELRFDPWVWALRFCEETLRELPNSFTALPDSVAMLGHIQRSGVKHAVVTNGWGRLQSAKMVLLQYYGPLFVSDTIGHWKPDPKLFEVALMALGVNASRALYVGDSASSDVPGANAAGMQVAWINEHQQTFPAGDVAPDFIVGDLSELWELI